MIRFWGAGVMGRGGAGLMGCRRIIKTARWPPKLFRQYTSIGGSMLEVTSCGLVERFSTSLMKSFKPWALTCHKVARFFR